MATKSQFAVNNYSQKLWLWPRVDGAWHLGSIIIISLVTSELYVKCQVLQEFNIILLSLDFFQLKKCPFLALSNVFFLIGLQNVVSSVHFTQ